MHDVQEAIRAHVDDVWAIQATLELDGGTCAERQAQFQGLQAQFHASDDPIRQHMGQVMASFAPGLFVGGEEADLPKDNLDLERWFKQPKGHERRIHGRQHAGVRIVQEGLQSMEGSLPPPLLQNRACHFCGTRLLSDAPSVIGIRPTVDDGWSDLCLTFRASPLWDIAPSRCRVGLALFQRYSSRSHAPHRPHVSISEALPSALAS